MTLSEGGPTAPAVAQESVIHQATGVLILALRVGPDAALDRLLDASQHHAIELTDLAEALVAVASGTPCAHCDLVRDEWGDLLL